MYRSLSRVVPVLFLASFLALPAYAAAKRSDAELSFFERIIKIVRTVIALEDVTINLPKP